MPGEEWRGGWVGEGEESMKKVHVDSLIKCNRQCRFILFFFMSMEIIYFFPYLASLVAQAVKNLPETQETWVRFLGWEDPLEEGMATHWSILAWRIPMDRRVWWATVQGVQRFGHNWVTKHNNSLFIYLPIYFLIIFSVYGHSQVAIFEVYKEHSCGIQVISVLISGQPPNCNSPQNNSFNSFGC